ncbi:hypothetical protein RI054_05g25460 [Pseudoscourfieldia marina]
MASRLALIDSPSGGDEGDGGGGGGGGGGVEERAEPQGPNPSPEISERRTREAPLIADAPHPPDALITCWARFIVGCRSGYVIYRVFWLLGPQAGAGALSGGPPWRLNVDFRIAVAKDIFDEGKRDYGAVFAQDGASAAAAAAAAPVKIVRYVGLSTEEKLPEQRHKRGFVSSPSVHSIAFALFGSNFEIEEWGYAKDQKELEAAERAAVLLPYHDEDGVPMEHPRDVDQAERPLSAYLFNAIAGGGQLSGTYAGARRASAATATARREVRKEREEAALANEGPPGWRGTQEGVKALAVKPQQSAVI